MVRRQKFESEDTPVIQIRHDLTGSTPGVLDPTQPSRVLRSKNSTLIFALYDPLAATSYDVPDLFRLSLSEQTAPPKPIVTETIPNRGVFWRFVPRARLEETVTDEGQFPRVVEICGELCKISQEQWNIYKLDPLYDCLVTNASSFTRITRKEPRSDAQPSAGPSRPFPATTYDATVEEYTEDDADSEKMSIDGDSFTSRGCRRKAPHPQTPKKRRFDFSTRTSNVPCPANEPQSKRKAAATFQTLRSPEEEENLYLEEEFNNRNTKAYSPNIRKRVRTLSPVSKRRALEARRLEHERKKQKLREEEQEARRQQREHKFMREVLSEVPPSHTYSNGHHEMPDILEEEMGSSNTEISTEGSNTPNNMDAEALERDRQLEESRRKMAELEADRPLWEAARKEREQLERQAEEEKRSRAELRRRQKEQAEREAKILKQEEAARELAEQQRRRAEKLARIERERRNRYHQWNSGTWSSVRAISRYKTVSQFFDSEKFGEDYPLTFHDIPWPTIRHPNQNTPQDMDWDAVKEFFAVAKRMIRGQEYRDFLKTSVSRFHPDRWSSRNLYRYIVDAEERDCVEVAAIAVSKALGNLWEELKNSS